MEGQRSSKPLQVRVRIPPGLLDGSSKWKGHGVLNRQMRVRLAPRPSLPWCNWKHSALRRRRCRFKSCRGYKLARASVLSLPPRSLPLLHAHRVSRPTPSLGDNTVNETGRNVKKRQWQGDGVWSIVLVSKTSGRVNSASRGFESHPCLCGWMAEWPNAPVLKTGDPPGSVGSNPTPSLNG